MKTLYGAIACLILVSNGLYAQHSHSHDHEHNHESVRNNNAVHNDHERNEMGVSFGALYGLDDKSWGTGVHVHYFRTMGEHNKWAIGGFAEHVWLDNYHFSFGAGARFEPVHRLSLGVFPGLTTAKHKEEHPGHTHGEGWKTRFSMHFEVVCGLFYWDHFHLGPAFDYSWSKNDSHFMLGIHGAFCF